MVDTLENVTVKYDRSEDTVKYRGPPEMDGDISSATNAVNVEKRSLLGSERTRAHSTMKPWLSTTSCDIGQFVIHTEGASGSSGSKSQEQADRPIMM